MDLETLRSLIMQIKNKVHSSDKLSVVRTFVLNNFFSGDQAVNVIDEFVHSSDKIDALSMMEPKLTVLSGADGKRIVAAFVHSSDKVKAVELIASHISDSAGKYIVLDSIVHLSDKEEARKFLDRGNSLASAPCVQPPSHVHPCLSSFPQQQCYQPPAQAVVYTQFAVCPPPQAAPYVPPPAQQTMPYAPPPQPSPYPCVPPQADQQPTPYAQAPPYPCVPPQATVPYAPPPQATPYPCVPPHADPKYSQSVACITAYQQGGSQGQVSAATLGGHSAFQQQAQSQVSVSLESFSFRQRVQGQVSASLGGCSSFQQHAQGQVSASSGSYSAVQQHTHSKVSAHTSSGIGYQFKSQQQGDAKVNCPVS